MGMKIKFHRFYCIYFYIMNLSATEVLSVMFKHENNQKIGTYLSELIEI